MVLQFPTEGQLALTLQEGGESGTFIFTVVAAVHEALRNVILYQDVDRVEVRKRAAGLRTPTCRLRLDVEVLDEFAPVEYLLRDVLPKEIFEDPPDNRREAVFPHA